MKPFVSIDHRHHAAIGRLFIDRPLSGYLAGQRRGGYYVTELEEMCQRVFHTRHAIACNSATSGLLAAAFVIGLGPGDRFAVPAMTMSATAAAPMFTGAKPFFIDVEDETFGIDSDEPPTDAPVFATNLFGHPANLIRLRHWCDQNRTALVEDNSQSPFAWIGRQYTGTIGHIGVFSLNIHKPIQCGEGGVIVTDDDLLAERLRAFINHGEHLGPHIGLNLRLPEICAAIALVQLQRGEQITQGRINQAQAIIAAVEGTPGIRMPITRNYCRHVYYTIPFLIEGDRKAFCASLLDDGVPIVEGYVDPLYRMPAFAKWARPCPVAEDLHDRRLFYFENCAWNVSLAEAKQIGAAFRRAAERAT